MKRYYSGYLYSILFVIVGMAILVNSFWNIDWFISINFGKIPFPLTKFHPTLYFVIPQLTLQSIYALFWYLVVIGVALLAFGIAFFKLKGNWRRKMLAAIFTLTGFLSIIMGYSILFYLMRAYRYLANPKPIWISYLNDLYPAWGGYVTWEQGMMFYIIEGWIAIFIVVVGVIFLMARTKPRAT